MLESFKAQCAVQGQPGIKDPRLRGHASGKGIDYGSITNGNNGRVKGERTGSWKFLILQTKPDTIFWWV